MASECRVVTRVTSALFGIVVWNVFVMGMRLSVIAFNKWLNGNVYMHVIGMKSYAVVKSYVVVWRSI